MTRAELQLWLHEVGGLNKVASLLKADVNSANGVSNTSSTIDIASYETNFAIATYLRYKDSDELMAETTSYLEKMLAANNDLNRLMAYAENIDNTVDREEFLNAAENSIIDFEDNSLEILYEKVEKNDLQELKTVVAENVLHIQNAQLLLKEIQKAITIQRLRECAKLS